MLENSEETEETKNDTSEVDDQSISLEEQQETDKMTDKFDIKTAANLLPVLDGKEETTQALLDAIEMYEEMIDAAGKKLLVTFVLKTRLDASSKLKLKSTYSTISALKSDIKEILLTKRSPTALSAKLNSARQNNKTIEVFGKEIEELFVQLTISQADGNSEAYEILRPTNEKLAIASFANGLKNNELRTIIKARNYKTLNETIRGALDEDKGSNSEQNVFSFRNGFGKGKEKHKNKNQAYRNNNNSNNNRGRFRGRGNFRGNYRGQNNNRQPQAHNNNQYRNNYSNNRNNNNSNFNRSNGRDGRPQNIRHFNESNNSAENSSHNRENQNENGHAEQFFRA